LSSTTSIRRPRRSGTWLRRSSLLGSQPRRTTKENSEPSPGRLSTATSPPISSTRRREMTRPSPVPPYCRVIDASACWKLWNSRASCASSMPMPVSRTEKRSTTSLSPFSTTATRITISPRSVNFSALLAKLASTWRTRSGSPTSRPGTWRSTSTISSSPLAAARSAIRPATLSSTSSSSKPIRSTDILPASILEKSRMSLMMPSRCWPEPRIFSR